MAPFSDVVKISKTGKGVVTLGSGQVDLVRFLVMSRRLFKVKYFCDLIGLNLLLLTTDEPFTLSFL